MGRPWSRRFAVRKGPKSEDLEVVVKVLVEMLLLHEVIVWSTVTTYLQVW